MGQHTSSCVYCGLDCGFTGYLTILDNNGTLVRWVKTPIIVDTTVIKRNKDKYNARGKLMWKAGHVSTLTETKLDELQIIDILQSLGPDVVLGIERQFIITGQGSSSAAKIVYGFGFMVGAAKSLGIDVRIIEAKKWQDTMLGIPPEVKKDRKTYKEATKQYSIAAAKKWRQDLDLRKTKKSKKDDHNLCDSINIALFTWQTFKGDQHGRQEKEA